MLRDFGNVFQRTMGRLLLRTVRMEDPWTRFPHDVPLQRFGAGAHRDFGWYLEGKSRVPVGSLDEMQEWLCGCTYARDPELFQEADFWQHPCTFEHLRKGDCEDFALWTWRKLRRLGFAAEFVAGCWQPAGCPPAPHAWVVFAGEDGQARLFDPVVKAPSRMVRPLHEVRAAYLPEVSVDVQLRRYAYAGYFLGLQAQPASHPEGTLPVPARYSGTPSAPVAT